jgi:hypothetical protein
LSVTPFHGKPARVNEFETRICHGRGFPFKFSCEFGASVAESTTRGIGYEKVPDAKTLARLGRAIGPEVICTNDWWNWYGSAAWCKAGR